MRRYIDTPAFRCGRMAKRTRVNKKLERRQPKEEVVMLRNRKTPGTVGPVSCSFGKRNRNRGIAGLTYKQLY